MKASPAPFHKSGTRKVEIKGMFETLFKSFITLYSICNKWGFA